MKKPQKPERARKYDKTVVQGATRPLYKDKPFPDWPRGLTRAEVDREFSRRLNIRMTELGFNQNTLAAAVARYTKTGKFGRDLISNYCRSNGKGNLPQQENRVPLANALRMDPHNLLPPVFPSRTFMQDPYKPPLVTTTLPDGLMRITLNMRFPKEIGMQILQLVTDHGIEDAAEAQ